MDEFLEVCRGFGLISLISVVGLLAIGCLLRLAVALDQDDFFYETRPERVKKDLEKKGYQNIDDFISSLLNSRFEDWQRNGRELIYYPFQPNKSLFFCLDSIREDSEFFSLSLMYKKAKLLDLVYNFSDQTLILDKIESGLGTMDEKTFNLKGRKLFEHLHSFVQMHREADETEAKRKRKRKELEKAHKDLLLKKMLSEKERQLGKILKTGQLWKEKQIDGFRLEVNVYLGVSYASFFWKGFPFVNVMWEKGQFTYEYVNEGDGMCTVFKNNIQLIESFCFEHLDEKQGKEILASHSNDNKQGQSSLETLAKKIEWLLLELKEEEEWLSPSDYHLVSNTYATDFHSLMDTFYQLKNPTDIEANVSVSLTKMHETLLCLSEKAEMNKKQMIEKQNRLIHIRE